MAKAAAAAKEALAINDQLPEAHTSLGVVSLRYDWDWQAAENSFKRAIELKPDYAPAHYWYSQLLLVTGKPKEAVAESEKAKKLDPFSGPSVMNYCRTLSLAGQYADAIRCYDNLLQENPKFDHAIYLRALVQQRSGQNNEALSAFQSLYTRNRALAGAALGYTYGRAGRIAEAQKVLAEMQALSKQRFVPPIEFAIIYIGMGDKDKAFSWLEEAYDKRFATLIYVTVDPIFSVLRSDPRYVSLVQRLNLPMPST
jgi:tetratricopeptide (TPR) repeat protein